MSNINNNFFDGYYKEIWRTMIPSELTVKEVDFMMSYFNLKPGHQVLDLMCGFGRHALSLSRNGINVTAVDNLEAYIKEICEITDKESLSLKAIQADVLEYRIEESFDLAICMGNSLNFFDADDTVKLLSNVASHLNQGGHLLINSWSLAEIVTKNFKEKSWSQVGEQKFLSDSKFYFHPSRIETESIVLFTDGTTETKSGIDYIFSVNEMENMLSEAGFKLEQNFSIPGRKAFTLGEPRAYLVATRQ